MSPLSIHATAVAIDGEALLIAGPSKSGKSRLAIALIARGTPSRPIRLIGDDRILLMERGATLAARPHPRIAGFLERRGLGIVAMDWVAEAPVGGIVYLRPGHDHPAGTGAKDRPDGPPRLVLETHGVELSRVLAWWDGRNAAVASHLSENHPLRDRPCAKD